jgi:hypothetical protein
LSFACSSAARADSTAALFARLAWMVVELFLAHRPGFRERRVAVHVELRLAERRLRLRELAGGLIDLRLEFPRVDLKQQLVRHHDLPFVVIAREDVTAHLRADHRVVVPVRRADPFAVDRHRLLLHHRGEHGGWRRRDFGARRSAPGDAGDE